MNVRCFVAKHDIAGGENAPEADRTKGQRRSWDDPMMMTCTQPQPKPAASSPIRAKYGIPINIPAALLRETGGEVLRLSPALELKT
jgi:hypothetical protein